MLGASTMILSDTREPKQQAIHSHSKNNEQPLPHFRKRGLHSTVCKNKNPEFTCPEHFKKPPAFLQDLVDKALKADINKTDAGIWCRSFTSRKRRYYPDRAKAVNALLVCFARNLDLATMQVRISLRNASDVCGLSTYSEAELNKADPTHEDYIEGYIPVPSTSRTSRAFKTIMSLGAVRAEQEWQVWDKEAGCWIDKVFEVTGIFFELLGVTAERAERQQNKRLGFLKTYGEKTLGLSAEDIGKMSLSELKEFGRQAWRRMAFERRSKEQAKRKDRRHFKKSKGNNKSLRQIAIERVQKAIGTVMNIDLAEFKRLVNLEMAALKRAGLQSSSPPS